MFLSLLNISLLLLTWFPGWNRYVRDDDIACVSLVLGYDVFGRLQQTPAEDLVLQGGLDGNPTIDKHTDSHFYRYLI